MLTVHATLLPNGQVQLPPGLAKARPVPVLVTILEPVNDADSMPERGRSGAAVHPVVVEAANRGSVENLIALLATPEFQALPKADPQEMDERIQELRHDWTNDDRLRAAAGTLAVNVLAAPG